MAVKEKEPVTAKSNAANSKVRAVSPKEGADVTPPDEYSWSEEFAEQGSAAQGLRRFGEAVWNGTLKVGHGKVKVGGDKFEGEYSYASRFENGQGTNPEELLGAAHAACFSMALSHLLAEAGFAPDEIKTRDIVHLKKDGENFKIAKIEVFTEADVPGIDERTFKDNAELAKETCPVSKALAGTEIVLQSRLRSS